MNRHEQRRWLAEQAARYMNDHAVDDPMQALHRVLARQSTTLQRRHWPEPGDILAALHDYQRLFRPQAQSTHLAERREAAREALRFFAAFRPYLVGSTLNGTADQHSAVQLHLHCEAPERVLLFMNEHGIVHKTDQRRIPLTPGLISDITRLHVDANGIPFELWLLPLRCERQAPLGSDGKTPIPRANLAALSALIEA